MLAKPDLPDHNIIDTLRDAYNLRVSALTFLPLGADVNSAVYRAHADADGDYFVKLRRGAFDELSLLVPHFLHAQGIAQVMAPLATPTGQLWTTCTEYTLTLYPFVAGDNAFRTRLSDPQWIAFGAALRQVHITELPPALLQRIPRETYTPHWRAQVRAYQAQVARATFNDPISSQLANFLAERRNEITNIVTRADALAQQLQARALMFVPCHADIHAGNVLVGAHGDLHIVDWDTLTLAPKERDLMFIGGGVGAMWNDAHSEALFYQGYGAVAVDLHALAYYRYERIVQDIAAFCDEIMNRTTGDEDRAQGLRWLMAQFQPQEVVAVAHRTYASLGEIPR